MSVSLYTMSNEYDTPKVLCQPSNALAYHTKECQKVKSSKNTVRDATENMIEWHDLPECQYCAGTYQAGGGKKKVVLND